jgi:hypothetical protein
MALRIVRPVKEAVVVCVTTWKTRSSKVGELGWTNVEEAPAPAMFADSVRSRSPSAEVSSPRPTLPPTVRV